MVFVLFFYCECQDCGSILRWLSDELTSNAFHPDLGQLAAVIWTCVRWTTTLNSLGEFLSEQNQLEVSLLGEAWINSYLQLAASAAAQNQYLFKVRPKFHLCIHVHIFIATNPSRRNLARYSCWMDEDRIRRTMRMKASVHNSVASLRVLQRNLLELKARVIKIKAQFHGAD